MRSKESCNSSHDKAQSELEAIDAVVGVAKSAELPQIRKCSCNAPACITVPIVTPHYLAMGNQGVKLVSLLLKKHLYLMSL